MPALELWFSLEGIWVKRALARASLGLSRDHGCLLVEHLPILTLSYLWGQKPHIPWSIDSSCSTAEGLNKSKEILCSFLHRPSICRALRVKFYLTPSQLGKIVHRKRKMERLLKRILILRERKWGGNLSEYMLCLSYYAFLISRLLYPAIFFFLWILLSSAKCAHS